MNHLIVPQEFLITSHSIDGTFESCARRFEFRHVIGMVPILEETGFAAEVGTAMHEALQEWSRTQSLDAGYIALLRHWPWRLEAQRKKASARNLDNAILMLESLVTHPIWEEYEVATLPDGTHAIELAYRINHVSLGGFRHPKTGRITFLAEQGKMDWILRHKVTKSLRVLDLKTTAYDEETHESSYRFSGQGGSYGTVLSAAVGHDFRKHGLEVTYLVAEFNTEGPIIRDYPYTISAEEVEDLILTKRLRFEKMLTYARNQFWPRRTHGCNFYGTPCGYLDVCHRRDYPYLLTWFAAEQDRFVMNRRIYDPYWVLEA